MVSFFGGFHLGIFDQLTLHQAHPTRIKETAHVGFAGNHGSGCAAGQSVAGRENQLWMAWQARKKTARNIYQILSNSSVDQDLCPVNLVNVARGFTLPARFTEYQGTFLEEQSAKMPISSNFTPLSRCSVIYNDLDIIASLPPITKRPPNSKN